MSKHVPGPNNEARKLPRQQRHAIESPAVGNFTQCKHEQCYCCIKRIEEVREKRTGENKSTQQRQRTTGLTSHRSFRSGRDCCARSGPNANLKQEVMMMMYPKRVRPQSPTRTSAACVCAGARTWRAQQCNKRC